ncbi:MAG: type II secretion system F family protein [bacterium]
MTHEGRQFACRVELRGGGVADRVVFAPTEEAARASVERDGEAFLLECRDLSRSGGIFRARKVPDEELIAFLRQWQVLLRAGMPVAQAMEGAVDRKERTSFARMLRAARGDIEGGRSVSEALAPFPQAFPAHFVAALSVAERTGTLPDTIGRQIDYLARMRDLRRTVTAAAAYPAILLVTLVGVSIFLLLYVIPNFAQIYSESKAELPAITVLFLSASAGFSARWPWVLAVIALAAVGLRLAWRTPARERLERAMLSMPKIGSILMDQILSRFSRTLSTLLRGGFPLLDSLRVTLDVVGNRHTMGRLRKVADRIEGGESLAAALRSDGMLPEIAVRLVDAGEKGGNLPEMLDEIAAYCEDDLRHRIKVLTALFEPVMMLFVGLIVGILVVAIYLPIFRIAGVVG